MNKKKKYDPDVWGPPPSSATAVEAPKAKTKFQKRFQNRTLLVSGGSPSPPLPSPSDVDPVAKDTHIVNRDPEEASKVPPVVSPPQRSTTSPPKKGRPKAQSKPVVEKKEKRVTPLKDSPAVEEIEIEVDFEEDVEPPVKGSVSKKKSNEFSLPKVEKRGQNNRTSGTHGKKNSAPQAKTPFTLPTKLEKGRKESPTRVVPPNPPHSAPSASHKRETRLSTDTANGNKPNPDEEANYNPYNLDDYRSMIEKISKEKRGGLGPSDTDEQRMAAERKRRQKEYGVKASKATLAKIAAQQRSSIATTEATDYNERSVSPVESVDSRGEARAVPTRRQVSSTHPPLPPPPAKKLAAQERRERALEYARSISTTPAPAPKRASIGRTSLVGAPEEVKEIRAVFEKDQRILDLEAKHEENVAAVKSIKAQL